MWTGVVVLTRLLLVLLAWMPLWAQEDGTVTPQDCGLDCIRQGDPSCVYCRITQAEVKNALGFNPIHTFGSCVPWPCLELLAPSDPQICQHFVQAPDDVTVEFVDYLDPMSDTIVVSWRPSYYGISFLRGFQVSLQVLGGSIVACQLFLFHKNLSLPASHALKVYKSDPFSGLPLGTQYAVTVMALPVPEEWERFYHSTMFSTRSCAEKNGLERCKKDWYPKHIQVQQNGTTVTVTFNLAPPDLGITSYFSSCYANGLKTYTDITPNSKNRTHHSYQIHHLQEGTNYTCVIAANEVDAVRKTFKVHLTHTHKEPHSQPSVSPLAVILPLGLALAAIFVVLLMVLSRRGAKVQMKNLSIVPDVIKQHQENHAHQEVTSLPRHKLAPPRLLMVYSHYDGPAHINAVLRLGAFIQQHMATQVSLDLWDTLRVAEEGSASWYCRQIRDCDFVLVICSRGFSRRLEHPDNSVDDDDESRPVLSSGCAAAVHIIGAEVCRARTLGRDLSKYMSATFQDSEDHHVPLELRLVSSYRLTEDLPLLFSHLHGVALHRPGGVLKVQHLSEEGLTQVPAGAALRRAIYEAGLEMRAEHDQHQGHQNH
ncbi:interleukin-17 receptor D isoform X1 [Sphaeramia orbicularis]|uniref:interleukin-17 receptor D isoform X1 n=1 Tax=Sphaeramia orbicularis TaxID=375764 RepID=UPI0011808BCB|nr:interleukin-17 receptor D-like isoform X1 [Sphaeramia orbicularis]